MADESGSSRVLKIELVVIAALLLFFSVMALIYSFGPIFEGDDEYLHYYYARYTAEHWSLPDPDHIDRIDVSYEFFQPPLYYWLTALIMPGGAEPPPYTFTAELGNIGFRAATTPEKAASFDERLNYNKNFRLHDSSEQFPYTQNVLALRIHITRLLSVVLGAITLYAGYRMSAVLWPHKPENRILMTAILAGWPLLQHSMGRINNDNMIIAMASIVMWLVVDCARNGLTTRRASVLGIMAGLALLSKVSGLVLMIPLALLVMFKGWKYWKQGLVILGLAILIAGWWYVRNMYLYGEPVGVGFLNAMIKQGGNLSPLHISPGDISVLDALKRFMFTLLDGIWGTLGIQYSIRIHPALRFIYFSLMILAGVAGVTRLIRLLMIQQLRRTDMYLAVLAGSFVGMMLMGLWYHYYAYWAGITTGRLLLPAATGLAAGMSAGLLAFVPDRARLRIASILSAGLIVLALIVYGAYYWPAYRPSPMPARIAYPQNMTYGDTLRLIGTGQPREITAQPGQTLTLSLYWEALASHDSLLFVFLDFAGDTAIPRIMSVPGTGNLMAQDFVPGQRWAEYYVIQIPPEAAGRILVVVNIQDWFAVRMLPAVQDGIPVQPVVWIISVAGH